MNEVVNNLQKALEELGTTIPSGSYFISGQKNTDIDFFVYGSKKTHSWLRKNGFDCQLHAVSEEDMDASMQNVEGFVSYRKDKFNVICLNSVEKLRKIRLATDLCTALKLKNKGDVLLVFNTIQLGIVSNKKTVDLEREQNRL